MFICYVKPLPFMYLESTFQHPRHKIRKASSRPNFSYLSGNFSSCVKCDGKYNNNSTKTTKFSGKSERRDCFLCSVMVTIEHHHWILHFRISLDTKFQLKLPILIFWTKFAQKGFFWSKTAKVNITIYLFIYLFI